MFTQHPVDSEFFDVDTFVDENMDALFELYESAIRFIDEHDCAEEDEDERTIQIASLVAAAVYADVNEIKAPMDIEEDHEDGMCDLAINLIMLMTLFSLINKGMLKRTGKNQFNLTDTGCKYIQHKHPGLAEYFGVAGDSE